MTSPPTGPGVFDVATVRSAEEQVMARIPPGSLMRRAATGLQTICTGLLSTVAGRVVGARVLLLIGTGNNGGDALWAGAGLARRGVHVDAITLGDRWHLQGAHALSSAGGRILAADDPRTRMSELIDAADLVIDGILGIGGRGALPPRAATWARAVRTSGALTVAVDLPSGVDADTGDVADPDACVDADVTVTFGCLKPGLLLHPGAARCGAVSVVDIGLADVLPPARCHVLDDVDLASCVPEPRSDDYKYSRGVAGIVAGSAKYRGAAFLAVAAARSGGAGMVRYVDRGDGVAAAIVDTFWDVVADARLDDARVRSWTIGPGIDTTADSEALLIALLDRDLPMVVDADALRLLAAPEGAARAALARRAHRGVATVLTPHEGEFTGLGRSIGRDRLAAVRAAAADWGATVLLKGPGTVVCAPDGTAYLDTRGGPELATAGSGDVLSGLLGSLLAGAQARSPEVPLDNAAAAFIAAAAVGLHGRAGHAAASGGRPVTARALTEYLPEAIAGVRGG